MKYFIIAGVSLLLLLACGQESAMHTLTTKPGPAGEAGEKGESGEAAKPCQVYCDGRSHAVIQCAASAARFKVKNCKEL